MLLLQPATTVAAANQYAIPRSKPVRRASQPRPHAFEDAATVAALERQGRGAEAIAPVRQFVDELVVVCATALNQRVYWPVVFGEQGRLELGGKPTFQRGGAVPGLRKDA